MRRKHFDIFGYVLLCIIFVVTVAHSLKLHHKLHLGSRSPALSKRELFTVGHITVNIEPSIELPQLPFLNEQQFRVHPQV